MSELVAKEKLVLISAKAAEKENTSFSSIKNALGEDISYGEVKLVLAALQHEKNQPAN